MNPSDQPRASQGPARPAQPRRLSKNPFLLIGPGLLLAATGVGAGDLATASIVGSLLGTAVLWAVVVGSALKYVVTEGLARWQLATGETLLEGAVHRLGRVVAWIFLPALLLWSFFVASALMSACGITLHAAIPLFDDPNQGKIVFGMISSVIGVALVRTGGYRLVEKVMSVFVGIMFVTVFITAILVWPGTGEVIEGLFVPRIPDLQGEGLSWTVALMGGVGGTFTVLCYGYWMVEEGREGAEFLPLSRIDLGTGYFMTALFGIAMVIIGSTITVEGSGAGLLVSLSDRLGESLGAAGKWIFLLAAMGAVFSSLLGVWQAVPYLFADTWSLIRTKASVEEAAPVRAAIDTKGVPYRGYLYALAVIPTVGLFMSFSNIQRLYAIVGAMIIPALALVLLVMNGRSDWVGSAFRNSRLTSAVLMVVLALFGWLVWAEVGG